MTGIGFVNAILRSLKKIHEIDMAGEENAFAVTDIITHVIYVRQGDVSPCIDELGEIGIQCYGVDCADIREPFITEAQLRQALQDIAGNTDPA